MGKLEKALREGRNLSHADKRKLFNLIHLNNDAGKFDMKLLLQYNDEYATDMENDKPDTVLQVTPRKESPPSRSRRFDDLPQSSSAQTDVNRVWVSSTCFEEQP